LFKPEDLYKARLLELRGSETPHTLGEVKMTRTPGEVVNRFDDLARDLRFTWRVLRKSMNTKLNPNISRRRFLASTSVATTVALLAPRHLLAQDDGLVQTARKTAAANAITVQKLRGNVSVLMGAGGNIAILPGRDGKLLIDAGFAGARPKISDALASISSDPIKHLINTHWHFDHTDGNEWLHSSGATILAHENTRKHLSTDTRVEGWNFTFKASPPGALPTKVFGTEQTVRLNGATIALKHYPPAHTDSDIYVHFTDADILHVADTFWNGYYPFIDYSTGGSIDGMIRATDANLAKVTDKMIVIPGHGTVGDKAQLTFYRDLLVGTRDKVATLKKQGKSLDEIVASKPTAATDTKWGGGFMSPKQFIGLVFQGV
jgi:glyoxylase-like metal-dependent hydrolase (beta-lactamase superfamily II)